MVKAQNWKVFESVSLLNDETSFGICIRLIIEDKSSAMFFSGREKYEVIFYGHF